MTKRIFAILTALFLLCACLPLCAVSVSAATFGDLTYEITDGEVTITDCDENAMFVEIPATIEGYPVTTIRGCAFSDCDALVTVTILDSVTTIGDYAFDGCTSLESVTIGNGVTTIGDEAFLFCDSLTSVTIGNSVTTIGDSAFAACDSLTSVTIPDSVTTIGDYAFAGCTALTSVTIGNGVTTIGESAFDHCTSLTEVTIPDSVTSIGDSAFDHCTSLTSVTIGDSVTTIGDHAFDNCDSLTDVYYTGGVPNRTLIQIGEGNNVLHSATWHYNHVTPQPSDDQDDEEDNNEQNNDEDNTLIVIMGIVLAVLLVVDAVFLFLVLKKKNLLNKQIKRLCASLHRAVFCCGRGWNPSPTCFFRCVMLQWKKHPRKGGNVMKKKIFAILTALFLLCACLPLSAVSVSAAKSGTTGDCTWTLDDDGHLTISGNGEMEDCYYDCGPWGDSITSVTIEDGVTAIGAYAFYGCTSLTSVTIGNGVTTIGESAFDHCTSLTSVYITDVAAWCAIEFYNYSSNPLCYAKNLYLNGALVTDLVIPDSVTTIGDYAFRNCTSLTSVTIGDSVTTIGELAFDECTSLTSVYITDVAAWCAIKFYDYSSNPLCYAKNLYLNGILVTDLTIPDSVTTIGEYAFRNCTSLTSVTTPDSVTTIGKSAFRNCTSLTSVTTPDSVTTIGKSAFRNCDSLTSVTIGDSVTTIVEYAFYECTSLTDVYYSGDKTDRSIIAIGSYNDPLQNATWHYEHGMAEGENGKEDRPSAEDEVAEGENDKDRSSAEDGFNWWIVVAAVSLIANAVLLFLLLKKKKSE